MAEVERLTPDGMNFSRMLQVIRQRIDGNETNSLGSIYLTDPLYITDPNSGVSTVIGPQSDGSWGIKQNVNDYIPPNTPSHPKLTTTFGTFSVIWDGKDLYGNDQPDDYDRTYVQMSTAEFGTYQTLGSLQDAGIFYVSDVEYDTDYYFRLYSVDISGNESGTTAAVSGRVQKLTDSQEMSDMIASNEQRVADAEAAAAQAQQTAQNALAAAEQQVSSSSSLVSGGSLNNGTSDLAYFTGIVSSSTDNKEGSGHIVLPASTTSEGAFANIPVANGNTYRVSYWTKSDLPSTGIDVGLKLAYYNGSDAWMSTDTFMYSSSTRTPLNSTWTLVTHEYKVPSGATLARIIFTGNSPAADVHIDNVTMFDISDAVKALDEAKKATAIAEQAARDAKQAQTTADSMNTVWYLDTPPAGTSHQVGDIWFDSSSNNAVHVWNGSSWAKMDDSRFADLSSAQDTLQSKYDQQNAQLQNVISDTNANTADIATALKSAEDAAKAAGLAQDSADGKSMVYYTSSAPASANTGDIWFTKDSIKSWNGSAWVAYSDPEIATLTTKTNETRTLVNGKTTSYFTGTAPSSATDGDLWFDTDDGNKPYIMNHGEWVSVQDKAISDLSIRVDSMDQKIVTESGNLVFWQTEPPTTARKAGDTWFDTNDGNKLYHWTGSSWTSNLFGASALGAGAVTTEKLASLAVTAEQLANNAVTATKIASAAVGTAAIADAAISSAKIQDASITSAKVAELNAGKITSGTLDSNRIAAKSITSDKLIVGGSGNLFVDPGFTVRPPEVLTTRYATGAGLNEINAITIEPGTTQRGFYLGYNDKNYRIGVTPGLPYRVSVKVKMGSGTMPAGSNCALYVRFVSSANPSVWTFGTPTTIGTGTYLSSPLGTDWQEMSAIVSPPAGSTQYDQMYIGFYANGPIDSPVYFCNPSVTQATSSTTIQDGAITTAKIAANAITAESGIIGSIDAGKISVGTLLSSVIGANTISTDKLIIGVGDNIVPNGEGQDKAGWEAFGFNNISGVNNGYNGSFWAQGTKNLSTANFTSAPGKYKVSVDAKANLDNSKFYVQVRSYDSSGTLLTPNPYAVVNQTVPNGTWQTFTGEITVPAGAVKSNLLFFCQHTNGNVDATKYQWFTGVSMIPLKDGSLIVQGSITGDRIKAGAITADSGIIASLDANKISTGYLSGARIAANTITTGHLGNGVVTTAQLAAGAVTGTTIQDGAITTNKITAGAITTEKFATNSITADSGIIASLDAAKITVGEMSGARIKAGSIQADRIQIGQGANLVVDSLFQNTDINNARKISATSATGTSVSADGFLSGTTTPSGAGASLITSLFMGGDPANSTNPTYPVIPGRTYKVTVRASMSGNGTARIIPAISNGNVHHWGSYKNLDTSLTEYTWNITIPDNGNTTAYLRFNIQVFDAAVTWSIKYPTLALMTDGTLLTDNSVTTEKIFANAITADKLAVGSVNAQAIQAGAVTATAIKSGAITADKITVNQELGTKLMTSGVMQTSTLANRGVKINDAGIQAYDDAGRLTMRLNGSSNYLVGNLSTSGEDLTGINLVHRGTLAGIELYSPSIPGDPSSQYSHGSLWYVVPNFPPDERGLNIFATDRTAVIDSDPGIMIRPVSGVNFQGRFGTTGNGLKTGSFTISNLTGNGYTSRRESYSGSQLRGNRGEQSCVFISAVSANKNEISWGISNDNATGFDILIKNLSPRDTGTIWVKWMSFVI